MLTRNSTENKINILSTLFTFVNHDSNVKNQRPHFFSNTYTLSRVSLLTLQLPWLFWTTYYLSTPRNAYVGWTCLAQYKPSLKPDYQLNQKFVANKTPMNCLKNFVNVQNSFVHSFKSHNKRKWTLIRKIITLNPKNDIERPSNW